MKVITEPQRRPRGRPREDLSDTKTNQSLEKALGILKSLSDHDGLNLTELSEATGLPPSTTHRLLGTLAAHNLVAHDEPTQKWSIGIEALRIGMAFQRRNQILVAGRPAMTELMEVTGETVNLALLDDFQVVFVSQVECHEPIRACFRIGERRALHASGIGKALLAEMPDARLKQFLQRPLLRLTDRTIADPDRLYDELSHIRQQGWSVDDEEANPGMRCVAAAIYNAFGEAHAGISVSGPSSRITPERLNDLGRQVRDTAARISTLIGGHLLA